MAIARQCDRCGKMYPTRICTPAIYIVKDMHPYDNETVDLCDDCQRQLEKWLGEKKEELR